MDELHQLADSILTQAHLISLGTTDDGGVWVADVNYVHDKDLNIYWVSSPAARHSVACKSNPQVAGAITVNTLPRSANSGIQLVGQVTEMEEILEISRMYAEKRQKPLPSAVGTLSGPNQRWYKLTPSFIEIIYEPKFGFAKQKITL